MICPGQPEDLTMENEFNINVGLWLEARTCNQQLVLSLDQVARLGIGEQCRDDIVRAQFSL